MCGGEAKKAKAKNKFRTQSILFVILERGIYIMYISSWLYLAKFSNCYKNDEKTS